jgi:uncharacterized phage protein (TIGR01671 family)
MREIKFRAWHCEAQEYCDGSTSNMFSWIDAGQPVTLEQVTGLQDKDGVDIYEGDIVAILFTDWASQSKDDTRSLEEYKQSKERVFPICFNKGCFQISEPCKYGDDFAYGDINCGTHGHIRVIGNIHENKELL